MRLSNSFRSMHKSMHCKGVTKTGFYVQDRCPPLLSAVSE